MGHVGRLSLNELEVNWDKRGSGAAGLLVHLCVFVCFLYVVLWKGFEGGERVMGWVHSLEKSNQGKYRVAGLFLIALGSSIYTLKYKQRTGTANPPKCKNKKWNDSKATLDYRVRVHLMERTCNRVTQPWALETKHIKVKTKPWEAQLLIYILGVT